MSTLTSPTVSRLLSRLYDDAKATDAALGALVSDMTPEQRRDAMSNPHADFRAFYHRARDMHLAVSPETGRLLYMLARANRARNVVEFGTSFGLSTVHLAAAIHDNGGGRLVGSDFEPSKIAHARANLEAANLAHLVDIREGDALETLARDLPTPIDFVLLDGAKPLYARVLALLEPHLRAGALIVADNIDACPDYVARVRAAGGGYLSVPFSDEVELTMRLAG